MCYTKSRPRTQPWWTSSDYCRLRLLVNVLMMRLIPLHGDFITDLPPPTPSAPPPSFSPPPSSSPGLLPFIAPLQHPMLPSRPVQPPSLQNKACSEHHLVTQFRNSHIMLQVPPSAGLDCSDLECSALDLLVHNPDFSIFVSLLQLADLIDILSLPGPVTIFAPTNKAFDGLPTPLFKVYFGLNKFNIKTTFPSLCLKNQRSSS